MSGSTAQRVKTSGVRAQDATLAHTEQVLKDLLGLAAYDVQANHGGGSSLDVAEESFRAIRLALDGIINARSAS